MCAAALSGWLARTSRQERQERREGREENALLLPVPPILPIPPDVYQSNRIVKPSVRGWIVPAARLLPPVATYLPVLALLLMELFGPVKLKVAFSVVNCTSLKRLYAWSCSLTPAFLRVPTAKRRDTVTSHSCHVGLRRIPIGLLPKFPRLPLGDGIRNAARLKCG